MSGQVSRRLHSRWCHRTGKNRQRQDRPDRHRATRRHGTSPQQLFRSLTPAWLTPFFVDDRNNLRDICRRVFSSFPNSGVLRQDTRASWEGWRPQTETDGKHAFYLVSPLLPFPPPPVAATPLETTIPSLPPFLFSSSFPPSFQPKSLEHLQSLCTCFTFLGSKLEPWQDS